MPSQSHDRIPSTAGGSVATQAQLAAQRAADNAAAEALSALRASAEKWQAAIGTILGLFAISGLIKGPDDLAKVDPAWLPAIAMLLAVGVALGLAATVLAARAAYGYPVWSWSIGDAYVADRRQALTGTASSLRRAIGSAILAFVAFFLAVGILWFGPRATGATYTLATTQTRIVCGKLVAVTPADITIDDKLTGDQVVLAAAEILVMQSTASCPTAP